MVVPRTRQATAPPGRQRPLVVTADPDLLDELLRIAADAGVLVDVAPDPAAARRWYPRAPLVLVGIDKAPGCLRAGLPRRPGVVLVGRHEADGPPDWTLADELGAEHVAALPAAEAWLSRRLAALDRAATGGGQVVAVLGGRGGAGATVLAASLAVTAARQGMRTLLVDADPLGGGADLALGWEALDGLRWSALSQVDAPELVGALPRQGELAVLSWDRADEFSIPVEAMSAALGAGRAERDLVVVDLPRRLDDAAVLALAVADRALLLVPAELRACAAAARVAAAVAPHTDALELVVRGPAPGRLKAREIARALGLPLLGSLRVEPDLARALERGAPPAGTGKGPLAALCQRILAELDLRGRVAS